MHADAARLGSALIFFCMWMLLAGCGRPEPTEPVQIAEAWAPAMPPTTTTGAAYMKITAHEPDRLVAASSPAAHSIEVHRTSIEDGIASMRPVESISLEAGETIALEPGGAHFMLIGITSPLEVGTTIQLDLHFERAGIVNVQVPVVAHDGDRAHH